MDSAVIYPRLNLTFVAMYSFSARDHTLGIITQHRQSYTICNDKTGRNKIEGSNLCDYYCNMKLCLISHSYLLSCFGWVIVNQPFAIQQHLTATFLVSLAISYCRIAKEGMAYTNLIWLIYQVRPTASCFYFHPAYKRIRLLDIEYEQKQKVKRLVDTDWYLTTMSPGYYNVFNIDLLGADLLYLY